MKQLLYTLLIVSFLFGCKQKPATTSNGQSFTIKVKPEYTEEDSQESPDEILAILKGRVKNKYPDSNTTVSYNGVSKTFVFEFSSLPEEEIEIAKLLASSQGRFEVSEVALLFEIKDNINTDHIFDSNDTLKLLRYCDNYTLGAVEVADTSKINAFFKTEVGKSLLPKEQHFIMKWGQPLGAYYKDMNGFIPLYCIRKNAHRFLLNEACKKTKIVKMFANDPEKEYTYIDIRLKSEYAKKFENITWRNIGRPLAISLDEIVLNSPIVNSAITGGVMVISGDFTDDEIRLFESFILNKPIKTPLKIVSAKKNK